MRVYFVGFTSTFLGIAALAMVACGTKAEPTANAETVQEMQEDAAIDLLDPTLSQWRGYKQQTVPAGWRMESDLLVFKPTEGGRGDLITKMQYTDFDLRLEWRVGTGGNSGVFFRVTEDHPATYNTGAEMQILDNDGHQDGKNPLTSAGSNYALHAPPRDVTRQVGQFNEARLVVEGRRVRQWLNGVLVVDYELWTDEWKEMVANSKFKSMPGYGLNETGHIALQDHGDEVAFRNVAVKNLSGRQPE